MRGMPCAERRGHSGALSEALRSVLRLHSRTTPGVQGEPARHGQGRQGCERPGHGADRGPHERAGNARCGRLRRRTALTPAVAALFIYPVKSCRGVGVSAARMTERGLAHDREWMIVDASGRFVSQRELPALALVRTALSDDALELSIRGSTPVVI